MNNRFTNRLEEYLKSECSDYDLIYSWRWDEDYGRCEVEISREVEPKRTAIVSFRYNERSNDLIIELCEDSWYKTREYDQTVKYFWMLIAPVLFNK